MLDSPFIKEDSEGDGVSMVQEDQENVRVWCPYHSCFVPKLNSGILEVERYPGVLLLVRQQLMDRTYCLLGRIIV